MLIEVIIVSYIIHNTCQVIVLAIHFLHFQSDSSSLQPALYFMVSYSVNPMASL